MTIVPGPEAELNPLDFKPVDFNKEVALITGIEYYRDVMFLDFIRVIWYPGNSVDAARTNWNAKGQIEGEDDYACGKCWNIIYDIVLEYASGKITCSSPANFYQELIAPKIVHPDRFKDWFNLRIGGNPSQLFFTNEVPQEKEEVPHIPHAPIKKPLWQRARKDFIRLVDDDKIPETHKRLNLHYLRTLPYEAISTAPPIIVEAPPIIVLSKGYSFTTIEKRKVKQNRPPAPYRHEERKLTHTAQRDVYESEIRGLLNDYTSDVEQLKKRTDKILYDKGIFVISYSDWVTVDYSSY